MGELLPARGVQADVQPGRLSRVAAAHRLDLPQALPPELATATTQILCPRQLEDRLQWGRVHRRIQRRGDPLPLSRQHNPDPLDPEPGSYAQLTNGQDTWSARCVETRTPGAGGGAGGGGGGGRRTPAPPPPPPPPAG